MLHAGTRGSAEAVAAGAGGRARGGACAGRGGVRVDALSDSDLVAAAIAARPGAHEEIFRRHWRSVWRRAYTITGRRESADDVTQDTFERAFRYLASFDLASSFSPWIHRIAVNRAIDALRADRHLAPLEAAAEIGAWDEEPGGDRQLRAAVARLSPERRAVLIMRYWLDLPGSEMAELLDVAVGTVHSRLSRALDEVRAMLEGGGR